MIYKPGLYLVSTPIGNLEDITLRALNVLKASDFIYCENTRISQKLLQKHNINTKLNVYNDHSTGDLRKIISNYIEEGKVISLISDAGTPLISDPGYKLVKELRQNGCNVDIVPGVSSPIAALTISSLASDRFLFVGFLPKTKILKMKIFQEFKDVQATLIFFETANRLVPTLSVAYEVFGNRVACVTRELTKLYQEVKVDSLQNLEEYYTKNILKGEITLLISREDCKRFSQTSQSEFKNIALELKSLIKNGLTTKSAIDMVHRKYKKFCSRKEIYKIANNL